MTTYELPAEPVGPVWTTTDDIALRWDRHERLWVRADRIGHGGALTWPELLSQHAAVLDRHPDLPPNAPLPWSWDEEDGIEDARTWPVNLSDDEVASFIVRAVNAYADQLGKAPGQ